MGGWLVGATVGPPRAAHRLPPRTLPNSESQVHAELSPVGPHLWGPVLSHGRGLACSFTTQALESDRPWFSHYPLEALVFLFHILRMSQISWLVLEKLVLPNTSS